MCLQEPNMIFLKKEILIYFDELVLGTKLISQLRIYYTSVPITGDYLYPKCPLFCFVIRRF